MFVSGNVRGGNEPCVSFVVSLPFRPAALARDDVLWRPLRLTSYGGCEMRQRNACPSCSIMRGIFGVLSVFCFGVHHPFSGLVKGLDTVFFVVFVKIPWRFVVIARKKMRAPVHRTKSATTITICDYVFSVCVCIIPTHMCELRDVWISRAIFNLHSFGETVELVDSLRLILREADDRHDDDDSLPRDLRVRCWSLLSLCVCVCVEARCAGRRRRGVIGCAVTLSRRGQRRRCRLILLVLLLLVCGVFCRWFSSTHHPKTAISGARGAATHKVDAYIHISCEFVFVCDTPIIYAICVWQDTIRKHYVVYVVIYFFRAVNLGSDNKLSAHRRGGVPIVSWSLLLWFYCLDAHRAYSYISFCHRCRVEQITKNPKIPLCSASETFNFACVLAVSSWCCPIYKYSTYI